MLLNERFSFSANYVVLAFLLALNLDQFQDNNGMRKSLESASLRLILCASFMVSRKGREQILNRPFARLQFWFVANVLKIMRIALSLR